MSDRTRIRFSDLAKLHLDHRLVVLAKVLLLGDHDLCAQDSAQQAFVMMCRVGCNMAGMMMARLALVTVD